jgi:hypothetical protein
MDRVTDYIGGALLAFGASGHTDNVADAAVEREGRVVRTVAIWVFGLLASAIVGSLLGSRMEPPYSYDWGVWGALAGMFTFACLRLWLAGPQAKNSN